VSAGVQVDEIGADLITVVGHKFGALKVCSPSRGKGFQGADDAPFGTLDGAMNTRHARRCTLTRSTFDGRECRFLEGCVSFALSGGDDGDLAGGGSAVRAKGHTLRAAVARRRAGECKPRLDPSCLSFQSK
jgi:hypothetical protein